MGALLTRHTRLEQDVSQRGDECSQLSDMALQLEAAGNFMSEEINQKVDTAINRYSNHIYCWYFSCKNEAVNNMYVFFLI